MAAGVAGVVVGVTRFQHGHHSSITWLPCRLLMSGRFNNVAAFKTSAIITDDVLRCLWIHDPFTSPLICLSHPYMASNYMLLLLSSLFVLSMQIVWSSLIHELFVLSPRLFRFPSGISPFVKLSRYGLSSLSSPWPVFRLDECMNPLDFVQRFGWKIQSRLVGISRRRQKKTKEKKLLCNLSWSSTLTCSAIA